MADTDRPEGHDVLLSKKEVCPDCGKDNLAVYADGHAHCFTAGCGYHRHGEGSEGAPAKSQTTGDLLDAGQQREPYAELKKRSLSSDTLRRYGVFAAGYMGKPVQVYPYYSQQGELVAQKLRDPFKNFPVLKGEGYPGLGKCQLFGRHVYGDKFDRQVIVCEGELDALSVAQALNFKVAVVSIGTGAGNAADHLKANYLWLDRFADIVLWFDNDEAGRTAVAECATLFKIGKVRIATASGFCIDNTTKCKDASDMLQAGRPGDIMSAVYAAQAWRPAGIVNAADCEADVKAPREKVQVFEYPGMMPKLQEMSGGIRLGELTFHVAGTGVGKSTQIREIIYDLAVRQGLKVGSMWFEDTRRDCQLLLMSIHAGRRLQLDPLPDPEGPTFEADAEAYDKKMLAIHKAVFSSRRFELFDAQSAEWTLDAIESYVRYMARGLDCTVVVIDPLSFVVQLMDATVDERRALDLIGARLAKAAKELNIAIHITHHLKRVSNGTPHEEGAPTSMNELRGSGGLGNAASLVIGWERNSQAEGEAWRVVQSRILKPHRMVGLSGLADVLYYGEDGRLVQSPIPFPPIGKPGGAKDKSAGFDPVRSDDY